MATELLERPRDISFAIDELQRRAQSDPTLCQLDSTIFGRRGMSQIRVPVFLMGGSDDIITPAVPEQIYPFTWLQTPNKYLAIIEKGTHFS